MKNKVQEELTLDNFLVNKYVMVRTYSAGVFAGTLVKRNGTELILADARRIWEWDGASSLSQLAMEGTSKPLDCKFPCEVTEILLTGVIEIIKISELAKENIKSVPIWRS